MPRSTSQDRAHDKRRLATILHIVLSLVVSCPVALAQQNISAETETIEQITAEIVQSRQKALESATDMDDATRARAAEFYKKAQDDLKLAEDWAGKSAEFEKAIQEAPVTLATIREGLSKPAPEVKPEIPKDAALQQLEQLLAAAEASLKGAQDRAAELDIERKRRSERRKKLPDQLVKTKQALDELSREMEAAAPVDEPSSITTARRTALSARRLALKGELDSYEKESASYDARGELLTARRDAAAREVSQAEALVKAWQEIVTERRRRESEEAAKSAQEARRVTARAHPLVGELARENVEWAERRQRENLADKIARAAREVEEITKQHKELKKKYEDVETKVSAAGLTHALGLLLRKNREEMADIGLHRREIAARQNEYQEIQVDLIELGNVRDDLADLEAPEKERLASLKPEVTATEREEIAAAIKELLQTRRDYVDGLLSDYRSYASKLFDLEYAQSLLDVTAQEFGAYIDEHILWIRSANFPQRSDLTHAWNALYWLVSPLNWAQAYYALGYAARNHPMMLFLGLAVFCLLILIRRRLRREIHDLGVVAARGVCRSFTPTVLTIVHTVFVSLPWPLLSALVGWTLLETDAPVLDGEVESLFSTAVGRGLLVMSLVYLGGEMIRQVCRAGGLAEAHFDISPRGTRLLRRRVFVLQAVLTPTTFVVAAIHRTGTPEWQNSLGRFLTIASLLVVSWTAARVLSPSLGFPAEVIARNPHGWIRRTRHLWYPLAVGLPIVLAILGGIGYYYTAVRLSRSLQLTVWLILGLSIANGMALRWLLLSRRTLAIEQARQRRAAAQAQRAAEGDAGGESSSESAPRSTASIDLNVVPELDLSIISEQSRTILHGLSGAAFVIGAWLIWANVLPALGVLDQVELWSYIKKTGDVVTNPDGQAAIRAVERSVPVTLADLGLSIIVLLISVIAAKNAPGFMEMTILKRLPIGAGERYAINTVARYALSIIGLFVAASTIGIGWSQVQFIAAAITLGLGFGLQEIFANFVSGLIVLMERPIRIGDVVTGGNVAGRVTRIRMRATTIMDWDRKELIVPNKEFVTGQIINWTLTDDVLRVIIKVGVAYGSDTQLARRLLLDVASRNDRALKEPAPLALFLEFGDSTLNLELRFFVRGIDDLVPVRDELHTAIDQAFRKAGIEIAFPQRDIHIRSLPEALAETLAARDVLTQG